MNHHGDIDEDKQDSQPKKVSVCVCICLGHYIRRDPPSKLRRHAIGDTSF